MVPKVAVQGPGGWVMVPLGSMGNLVGVQPVRILVTRVDEADHEVPLFVREALVEEGIQTFFTGRDLQLRGYFPPKFSLDDRFAYAEDVAETLEAAGKQVAAAELRRTVGEDKFALIGFSSNIFRAIDSEAA